MDLFFSSLTKVSQCFVRSCISSLTILLILLCPLRGGAVEYQTTDAFIQQAFNGSKGTAKVYWVDDSAKQVIESILAHSFNKMRIRYWQQDNETVWILDEIGKEAPITVGIHIKAQAIVNTKVLIYRESRGDEVRHSFFTDQFKSAKLVNQTQLDRHIDGITGATLSVRALTKLSRMALWLDSHVTDIDKSQ
ncbi:FMN-binding protein [Shewanella xiamenensis]|uniref:FMN-binding protein n=1 Tax=Shewanella xiamenensis TaxID=332186 RepID=UPI0009B7B845|nr:FMN-binding protein [Shewanella xiamenensis]MCL1071611.1 FMN-binding protein [Shewanella xiamenensis]MCR4533954.1 FMN-binding protein [Shewanella xiamenensis]WHF57567.1 FMN-binding protein [Shewanella xiamenensis]